MGLKTYRAKRNFNRTREPKGVARSRRLHEDEEPLFVVQKHAATRLHYDFRLAMQGVLKSWAVPKGFPTRKGDRRLAVQVEDHPLDYARFEGTIPEGNYGAGTVMVWDLGRYEVLNDDPARAIEKGKLHLKLNGKKLKGEWTLVRMRHPVPEDKPQWLLLKSNADAPPFSARTENTSALTRRTLETIAAENTAQWHSDRISQKAAAPVRLPRPPTARTTRKGRVPGKSKSEVRDPTTRLRLEQLPKLKPGFIEPMKAMLKDELPAGSEWSYEIKFDGVRALAIKQDRQIKLLSRNAVDLTRKYPALAEALRELPASECVLDGEITALDPKGRPSFQLLQSHQMPGQTPPSICYYVFDVLQLDGRDLTGLQLQERKTVAERLISDLADVIRFSAALRADLARLIREMQARGLEGLIAKRIDAPYEIGRRSPAWVKLKWTCEQEFVIGGFTPPKGSRSHFGAILAGYYEGGKLLFASRIGSGFDEALLKSLYNAFQELVQSNCPFANLPEPRSSAGRGGITATEMRRCTWVKPELICQVRFTEWTRDGHLRHPVFLGMREDKRPTEVVRERAGDNA